jgi:phenylacetate-CoA ligase
MDYMTDMLKTNFEAQGVRAGMMVANLFVAGNLWSSFMAVDKAMQKVGAIQLPIGGLCQLENIVMYLQKFRPEVILGIPSMLVSIAEYAQSRDIKLEIDKVFYAGEALSAQRREFLNSVWDCSYIGSAGYASVDAGVVAYQCSESAAGVHHLFSDLVQADIINDELVVTSVIRSSMPIVNYRTGDRAEWIEGQCACGRRDRRFKLLGRIDNQIQIWSCRLEVGDVENILSKEILGLHGFQIVVDEQLVGETPEERLTILCETKSQIDEAALTENLYYNSRDLKDTISLKDFAKKTFIQKVSSNELIKNSRTGKIPLLVDKRKQ